MDWLKSLLTNPFLITGMSSWLVAQVLKMIINAIINKSFSLGWLFSDGGMPSGHSATVTSLCVLSALARGPGSFEFAVTFVLAFFIAIWGEPLLTQYSRKYSKLKSSSPA